MKLHLFVSCEALVYEGIWVDLVQINEFGNNLEFFDNTLRLEFIAMYVCINQILTYFYNCSFDSYHFYKSYIIDEPYLKAADFNLFPIISNPS